MKTRGKLKPSNGVIYWNIVNATKSMTTYHQIITFTKAFAFWGQYLHPIRFESTADPKQAHIRIHFVEDGHPALHGHMWGTVAGFAYYPDGGKEHGNMYFNEHRDWSEPYRYYTFLHEIGHVLCLMHALNPACIMAEKKGNPDRGTVAVQTTIAALQLNYGIKTPEGYIQEVRGAVTPLTARRLDADSIEILSVLFQVDNDKEVVLKRLFEEKKSI